MSGTPTAILVARNSVHMANEAVSLCEAAGYRVCTTITRHPSRNAKYGLSVSTLERIEESLLKTHADIVVCDEMIRPRQNYNIASKLHVRILDREALILEIFDLRASSDESKQQVRLAQLRYEMTRAREKVRLARMGEQPGFMGIGQFEVDVYYNDIRHRMQSVRVKLQRAAKRRELHRKSRARLGLRTISLAGYTSSGKTTLFNALTGEDREQSAELFTTLVTTVRRAEFDAGPYLVTDTVGFISDLPAYMIEAFKSTLEEMTYADAIILVVDASDPQDLATSKLRTCIRTLSELDVQPAHVMIALNKSDLVGESELDSYEKLVASESSAQTVRISALSGDGIDKLKLSLQDMVGDT